MAVGWSPLGSYSDCSLKRMPPSDLSGPRRAVRRPGPIVQPRITGLEQPLQSTSAEAEAPVRPRGCSGSGVCGPLAEGRGRSPPEVTGAGTKRACGISPNPSVRPPSRSGTAAVGPSLVQRRVQQRREMLVERDRDPGARPWGPRHGRASSSGGPGARLRRGACGSSAFARIWGRRPRSVTPGKRRRRADPRPQDRGSERRSASRDPGGLGSRLSASRRPG